MNKLGAVLGVFAFPFIVGCSSSEGAANESAAALAGDHYPASHCEVFVDRVAPYFTSHGVSQITIYLKTPVDKLAGRGGVKSAGFFAQENAAGQGSPPPFTRFPAQRFEGAQDYWKLNLAITSDMTPTKTFKGAFYVEANDGTILWLNASEGGRDFVVDSNMVGNLQKLRSPGFFSTDGSTSPSKAVNPADEFPYLNAQSCR